MVPLCRYHYHTRLYGHHFSFNLSIILILTRSIEHLCEVALTISTFLSWQDKSLHIGFNAMVGTGLLVEEARGVLVVYCAQALVHAGHDADVVVVEKVYFLEVELGWQVTFVICEKEFCNRLRKEYGLHLLINLWHELFRATVLLFNSLPREYGTRLSIGLRE